MFSQQAGQLTNALVAAGLSPTAASTIASILGNASQGLVHRGPQTHDTTPESMRYVTPDTRKQVLTNLDFRQADPDYRQPLTRTSEEQPKPEPEPTVLSTISPQQRASTFRVLGGAYTSAEGRGEFVSVGLRVNGAGEAAFLDPQSNSIVAKTLRAEADTSSDGRLRFFIERPGREVVWKLQLKNVGAVEVVTNVQYVAGEGLVMTYETISAWKDPRSQPRTVTIPVQNIPLVTDITLGDDGLVAQKASVTVFEGGMAAPTVIATTDCPET